MLKQFYLLISKMFENSHDPFKFAPRYKNQGNYIVSVPFVILSLCGMRV